VEGVSEMGGRGLKGGLDRRRLRHVQGELENVRTVREI
jgi:hypothetical protein